MPMNGGGTSSRVPGAAASPNATIKSADYNAEMDDVYGILNTARPIAYGGTGASTADGAATSLEVVRYGGAQSLSTSQKEQARDNIGAIAALKGHIYGLTLSNNTTDATNDIDIAAGEAASDGSTAYLMTLSSALTKRLDGSWAVGSGSGGLDTGSIADTTYHVWIIQRSDTGVVDALFSTSATSPTMPANYDRKRRIGSIIRLSGAIVGFTQKGDEFLIAPRSDSITSYGTTATLLALTVPTGVSVGARISGWIFKAGASSAVLFSSPDQADTAASTTAPASVVCDSSASGSFQMTVRTNASSQIRVRAAVASTDVRLTTDGWYDTRGRTE